MGLMYFVRYYKQNFFRVVCLPFVLYFADKCYDLVRQDLGEFFDRNALKLRLSVWNAQHFQAPLYVHTSRQRSVHLKY